MGSWAYLRKKEIGKRAGARLQPPAPAGPAADSSRTPLARCPRRIIGPTPHFAELQF